METVRMLDYYYTVVPDKSGEGRRILKDLKDLGVNLHAFSGFPAARKSQLDFVPHDSGQFATAAKMLKVKLKGPKKVFLVEGDDRVGALSDVLGRLASAKINVTAVDGVAAGGGRWGAILWVKPRDVKKAAQALGVTTPVM